MSKNVPISIVMPVYNAEQYIREAIDSIINQSFIDFECIIINDGSTDKTKDIIKSYDDKRIILIDNKHDFISSLNLGLKTAKGKYIARMDADDIMHPDRLKIQYHIMETEQTITVCGTCMTQFGENVPPNMVLRSFSGLVEYPLLMFLQGNFVFHPTVLIRKSFLRAHSLEYQNYSYAEGYKLWIEIAKNKGSFYIESQPLLNYRISENQVTKQKNKEQKNTAEKIQLETLQYLLDNTSKYSTELKSLLRVLTQLKDKELITNKMLIDFIQMVFNKNKIKLF